MVTYDPGLTTVILSGLNSVLLVMVAYFIKGWYEHVNERIKALTDTLTSFKALEQKVETLSDEVNNVRDDVKAIEKAVTIHVAKATAP